MAKLKELIGKTMASVRENNGLDGDEIIFETKNGEMYKLYHSQSCCEDVCIESIIGNLSDLEGSPILVAEEVLSHENPT